MKVGVPRSRKRRQGWRESPRVCEDGRVKGPDRTGQEWREGKAQESRTVKVGVSRVSEERTSAVRQAGEAKIGGTKACVVAPGKEHKTEYLGFI